MRFNVALHRGEELHHLVDGPAQRERAADVARVGLDAAPAGALGAEEGGDGINAFINNGSLQFSRATLSDSFYPSGYFLEATLDSVALSIF